VVDSDSDFSRSSSSTLESVEEKELLCYGSEVSQQDMESLDREDFADHDEYLRQGFPRRPSHDLFECIEQSQFKRLSEKQARHVFAQIVDAVLYLDSWGISHCDIKDENILVNADFNVCFLYFFPVRM
jgi:serine/threonine protein kinase